LGIVVLKTLFFLSQFFSWVAVDGPASFEPVVDYSTGGLEGTLLLDAI
jgi:hypothetical protein